MSTATTRLNAQQTAQYQTDGYTIFDQAVFSPARFAALSAIFEEDLLLYGADDLDTIHFRDARLLDFLLDDAVLNIIEPVIGPNIGLWSSHFISKEPFKGKRTPWHEDSAYWNGRISTMENICTVWLAMDEATPENGCLKVVAGSQSGGFSDYDRIDGANALFEAEVKPELIDESKVAYLSLQPNHCSLHEARIIHGADANTSPKRRAGYTMRYFPTTSLVYAEKNEGHKLWLARGVDVAGNKFENA